MLTPGHVHLEQVAGRTDALGAIRHEGVGRGGHRLTGGFDADSRGGPDFDVAFGEPGLLRFEPAFGVRHQRGDGPIVRQPVDERVQLGGREAARLILFAVRESIEKKSMVAVQLRDLAHFSDRLTGCVHERRRTAHRVKLSQRNGAHHVHVEDDAFDMIVEQVDRYAGFLIEFDLPAAQMRDLCVKNFNHAL